MTNNVENFCKENFQGYYTSVKLFLLTQEVATGADLLNKLFLKKFRYIHRETSVLESLFNKVAGLVACSFIKKWLEHMQCFPVNIAKTRTSIF